MKRRIGILTFHTAINYGAVLQAFALQQTLIKMYPDDEVKIIDFRTKEHVEVYKVFKRNKKKTLKNFVVQVLSVPRNILLVKRRKRFLKFTDNNLVTSQRIATLEEFLNNPPDFDIYISGSDQVFNPRNKHYKANYLGFKKGISRKVAYAPSCGLSKFSEEEVRKIKNFLSDFDVLSCRETVGANILSSITQREIPIVLDPVFLLNAEEWDTIARKPKFHKKYIFVYDLNGGKELLSIAQKIANKTGLDIICQTQKPLAYYKNTKMIFSAGPKEFLGYMQEAEYVVTDSFHGTAFAILFNKPFYSYIATPYAASRIISILNSLNLQDFLIEYNKVNEFEFRHTNINDYRNQLQFLIKESLCFLQNAL